MNKNEIFIAAFTIVLVATLYFILESVIVYLGISIVLAIIGSPLVKLIQRIKIKNTSIPKGLASFVTLLSFYALIAVGLSIVLPFLSEEAKYLSTVNPNKIISSSEEPIEKIEQIIFDFTSQELDIEGYLKNKVISVVNFANVSNWINAITGATGGLVLSIFGISFITFFFLKDGRMFFDNFKKLIPPNYRSKAPDIIPLIKTKLTRYFIGLSVEVLIIFVLMNLGLYLVGVKYFIVIATVAAMFNVIPYIGPIIGIVFGLVVVSITLCTSNILCIDILLPALGKTFLIFAIVQALDNVVLQPIIYGKSVNAHPLEIFLVVIISGNLWGTVGLIVAIPLWSVVKIVLLEIQKSSTLIDKVYQRKK